MLETVPSRQRSSLQCLAWVVARARNRWLALGFALLSSTVACESEKPTGAGEATSSGVRRRDLTPELEQKVLARVGDRDITLGDYVSALERMDAFERLRYQTPERRKLLLDEMIEVELLAREAERRGLRDEPETKAYLRQLLREEVLRRLRDEQPRVEELPAAEVRAYYEAHPADFHDPERRRVAVIELADASRAKQVLEQLEDASAERWGELARQYSLLPNPAKGGPEKARPPLELEGDLGLVTAPGETRGENPRVPEAVRRVAFELDEPGEIHDDVVTANGHFYVVRLISKNSARQRTLEEADAPIRVKLLQERIRKAEQELEARLRQEFPVHIDEAALSRLELPKLGPGRQGDEPAPSSAAPAPSGAAPAPSSAASSSAAPAPSSAAPAPKGQPTP